MLPLVLMTRSWPSLTPSVCRYGGTLGWCSLVVPTLSGWKVLRANPPPFPAHCAGWETEVRSQVVRDSYANVGSKQDASLCPASQWWERSRKEPASKRGGGAPQKGDFTGMTTMPGLVIINISLLSSVK